MNPVRQSQNEQSLPASDSALIRRPYVAPALTTLGDIHLLTEGAAGGNQDLDLTGSET